MASCFYSGYSITMKLTMKTDQFVFRFAELMVLTQCNFNLNCDLKDKT